MQKQKYTSVAKKKGLYIVLALTLFVGAPVLGAILVQNFTQWNVVVDTPPIEKVAGADDAATTYLTVNVGGTITNNDSGDATPGTNDTNLSHEEISFTCFAGDRTYYTDVLRLNNTTVTEDWNVTLTVEDDLNGNPAVEDTFDDAASANVGDADIWLFTSTINGGTVSELPNPANYGSLTEWMHGAGVNGAIQLEVVDGTLSIAQNQTGPFLIPAGDSRQLGLVVDCGENMVDGETGTFRMTVGSTPN
ncbi:MAG: hypothetical protein CR972_03120 [Candidatus Moraniibacteriota bacterium]|nr:MAG: hypothetical protein CR972_03120 [Candidatus Moranbacteria bacterium]